MSNSPPFFELVAPAGNPEKLEIALRFGADAVYLSDSRFGLRSGAGNFSLEELAKAVKRVHALTKKIYVAVNVFAHEKDLAVLPDYLNTLNNLGVDAVIVTDPGVLRLAKIHAPDIPITLSTQANTLNSQSALFWQETGISRIVLARELTLDDIKSIHMKALGLSLEVFVHGAVCMSYAGRCFISNYLTGRDANRGDCTNSCRWKYYLHEEKRPGELYPIEEDGRGTYFFNSKDLNMLSAIPDLISAGVTSFKIEGRGKSILYLATVVSTYRAALDSFLHNPKGYEVRKAWMDELEKIPHRGYSHGFLYGPPDPNEGYLPDKQLISSEYLLAGVVREAEPGTGIRIDAKNKIELGDSLDCITPKGVNNITVESLLDEAGKHVQELKPGFTGHLSADFSLEPYDLLRKKIKKD